MLTPVPSPEVPIISGHTADFFMPDSTTPDDAFQQEDIIDIREYEETPVVVPLVEVSSLETPTKRPQEIICYQPNEVFEEPIEVSCVNPRSIDIPTVPMDLVDEPVPEPILLTGDGTYPLPHDLSVQGEAAGMGVRFLIDTGAAITVVSTEFLQKSPLGYTFPLKTGELQAVKTVSGEQLPVQGKIFLPLTIEDTQYNCEAYVIENLGYDFVLGRDFLRQNSALIDLGGGTLRLQTADPPYSPAPDLSCQVRVQSTCVVPPYCEVLIPAKLSSMLPCTTGLIEPNSRLAVRYHLQGAALLAVVSPGNQVPFWILNPTSQPVTLYRETNLGSFQELAPDVATISLESNPSSPPTPTPFRSQEVPINWGDSPLSADQRSQLRSLLNEYRDVFALTPEELGRTGIVKHHIDTGNEPPIRLRPYRVAQTQRDKIAAHVEDMLDRNIIQPSVSPWAAPVVLVRKNDGQDRFCVDYRRLNQITKKDSYPLPRIDDTLDALSGVKYFSTLDLLSGYWQLEMDPSSREKTAFATHCGLYEFLVMPFGLTNAPSSFQRVMECALQGLN